MRSLYAQIKLRTAFARRASRTPPRRFNTSAFIAAAVFVCATFSFGLTGAQTRVATAPNRAARRSVASKNISAEQNNAPRWTRVQSGNFAHLRAVFFLDKQTGWAAGGAGAWLTTKDGGATWQPAKSPTEDTIRDIYFHDQNTGTLLCERNIYKMQTASEPHSYLLQTTDAGATWTRVDAGALAPDARLWRIVFADRQHGWTFGESGVLLATTDGGATWARQRVSIENLLLGASFIDGQTGWIVGGGASVLATTNGGATWRVSTTSNPSTASNQTNGRSSTGNVSGANNASTANRASANSSQPVSRIVRDPSPQQQAAARAKLYAVSFFDARFGWAVGARGAIYQTQNGGATWRLQSSNTDADLFDVKFADNSRGWAVGAQGTLLETRNGGATWTLIKTDTTHNLERLHVAARGALVCAVGFGGTIFRLAADDQAPRLAPQLRTGSRMR